MELGVKITRCNHHKVVRFCKISAMGVEKEEIEV